MINNDAPAAYSDETYISHNKREFRLWDDVWSLSKDVSVSLAWAEELADGYHRIYRELLAEYASAHAGGTVAAVDAAMRSYVFFAGDNLFSDFSFISFRSSRGQTSEGYLARLRPFLYLWNERGYEGISDEVVQLLKSWKIKGNKKGHAVQTMDVQAGPITDIEMSGLLDALTGAYVKDEIDIEDYTTVAVFAYTGRRAIQISDLKFKDLTCRSVNGANEFSINFPRAKQEASEWRSTFTEFPIVEDLWLLLAAQKNSVIERVKALAKIDLDQVLINELPVFPNYSTISLQLDQKSFFNGLQLDYYHRSTASFNYIFDKCMDKLNVISERTGKRLKLVSRRFRYTLGTNMGREGRGVYVIAQALDHSDIQNAGVYVRNLPDIVERIDKAVAFQLAPLAQAFQGVLIDSESQATRGHDKASRISNSEKNLGNCGSFGFCGALAPIACYTCVHFEPWMDGPHDMVLNDLLADRAYILEATKDAKMAAVNDRTILAVADCIQRCNAKKERAEIEEGK